MSWGGPHCDAAERPEASYTPDIAALCDNPVEALYREATESYSSGGLSAFQMWLNATTQEQARVLAIETLSRVLPILVKPGNVRMRVMTLLFAINSDALNGTWTQTAAAKEMGVTRAAVSKGVQWWLDFLGLRRNAHTKSAEAVESYRTVQRERHWRRQIVGKKGGKNANH
jgi:hypothetical protein